MQILVIQEKVNRCSKDSGLKNIFENFLWKKMNN